MDKIKALAATVESEVAKMEDQEKRDADANL
jgi:hypothetical protein